MAHAQRMYTHCYQASFGPLYLAVDKKGVVHRISHRAFGPREFEVPWEENKFACGELEYQLDQYLLGKLKRFTLEVSFSGTAFQEDVWNRLMKIPYGETMNYAQVAQKIGRKLSARAVGVALGCNPIAILIPCHRVIRSDGRVGDYVLKYPDTKRGTEIKSQLLEIERKGA